MFTFEIKSFKSQQDLDAFRFLERLVLCVFFTLSLLESSRCKDPWGESSTKVPGKDHWLHGNATCRRLLYGHGTFSKYRAASPNMTHLEDAPLVEMHVHRVRGRGYLGQSTVPLLQQIITRPLDTLSILEPRHRGACTYHRYGMRRLVTVRETAAQDDCLLAINAGFFNSQTGACLGNIVSDGLLIQSSGGIQNAHFGLTRDGYIFTGYPSKSDVLSHNFTQLVGGVIWLVKEGVNNVDQSIQSECPITQETGTMGTFAACFSGRAALGHDAQGRVHFLEVDGKTFKYGVSLYSFADKLIQLGIVNAINLDGGGSVTVLANGDLVNRPSDKCMDNFIKCEREVSTAVCVHAPRCSPTDACWGQGSCQAP
ncbi:N-acetylglucosamine-1-phosphodiester alpha-N-acetylglucosaminidase-like [Elysia marginata]|uniref:N-acetylglucosamine-1-phosphodiester alpha-N-acetylglucosaminidase-like n=1 Tax=Elysia marginata TaxID=1093978 RepID=A0AAV4GRH3_9GAST|nr:N-acetylglucosamine-1-phosphodiester alpha-N-acetylglucosaminidase-like [Elysia marginata]